MTVFVTMMHRRSVSMVRLAVLAGLALGCTDGTQPLAVRAANDAGRLDAAQGVDAAPPDQGFEPEGCDFPAPTGPVLWTPGRDRVVVLEGPVCLPRFIPVSIGNGEAPYRWLLPSPVPSGVRIDDANQASARIAIPPGFVGELDVQVWDGLNTVTELRIVSPERGRAAWWPVSVGLRDDAGNFVADIRFIIDKLLIRTNRQLWLEDLMGEVLASTPFDGNLALGGPDQAWQSLARFSDTNISELTLLRLRPGCVDRVQIADRLSGGHGWLLGGRAGYGVLPGEQLITWVVRDDDSLALATTDMNGALSVRNPNTGARTRLLIQVGANAAVAVLAADGALSHRIELPQRRSLALRQAGTSRYRRIP